MKRKILLLIMCIYTLTVYSTGVITETIELKDIKMRPMSGTLVTLIETTTKERMCKTTDGQGKASFIIKSGKEWSVNVLKIKNYKFIDVPESGTGSGSMMFTYDYEHYERTHRAPVDRSLLVLQTEDQSGYTNVLESL